MLKIIMAKTLGYFIEKVQLSPSSSDRDLPLYPWRISVGKESPLKEFASLKISALVSAEEFQFLHVTPIYLKSILYTS
jgi:hypothetical protein